MSIRIMSQVWDRPCESCTQKLVLLALADNANDEGVCWPSLATIAKKCNLDKSNVCRHIKRLVGLGLCEVEQRTGVSGQISSRYTLKVTPVAVRDTPCRGTPLPPVAVRDTNLQYRTVIEPSEEKEEGALSFVKNRNKEKSEVIEFCRKEIAAIAGRLPLTDADREQIKELRHTIYIQKNRRW